MTDVWPLECLDSALVKLNLSTAGVLLYGCCLTSCLPSLF